MRFPVVSLHVPMPRLLPVTIVAMAALLAVKSVALVRAAAPAAATEAPAAANPAAVAPEAKPTPPPIAAIADAKSADAKVADTKPGDATAPPAKPDAPAAAPPAEPPISESERSLLVDLRKRRDELDTREAALAARESLQAAADARLTARLGELGGLQKRLESLEAVRREHDEANWRGLVKLYESMKPKDAAAIFNDLDLPVLLPVLDRMKEQKAALVMAAMLPERARLVTAELAQMRAHANAVPPAKPAAAGAAADTASPGKLPGGG